MKRSPVRPALRRRLIGTVAIGAAATVLGSCTQGGLWGRRTTTTRQAVTTTTAGHGHGHIPDRLNHPPTAEQQAWARDFVRRTRESIQRNWPNRTVAAAKGYNDIGDGQHYTNGEYRHDGKEMDPEAIESLVVNRLTGQVEAAMYNMEEGTTVDNVQDYAGNWIIWHNHDNLCWQNDVRGTPGYTRLGGVVVNGQCTGGVLHEPVLMVHVWIVENAITRDCGAFASIPGIGEGACVPEFQP